MAIYQVLDSNPIHLPQLPLSSEDLAVINASLRTLTPQEILRWAIANLPNLAQTTAFGLTGLVALDMISKLVESPKDRPPIIFLDTLYHFPETYELLEDVKQRYGLDVHVFKPYSCNTMEEFEQMVGQNFWKTDEYSYQYLVKVEPSRRAYDTLSVKSIITGRRASQGDARSSLQPLEVDSTGLLKLNPLCSWSFQDVEKYITEHNVPRNKLLSQGYRSIGDWHSTSKVGEGQGERAGRWVGTMRTECGLHEDYFEVKAKAKVSVKSQVLHMELTHLPRLVAVISAVAILAVAWFRWST